MRLEMRAQSKIPTTPLNKAVTMIKLQSQSKSLEISFKFLTYVVPQFWLCKLIGQAKAKMNLKVSIEREASLKEYKIFKICTKMDFWQMNVLTSREACQYWENCKETKLIVMRRTQMMTWCILRAVRTKFTFSVDKTVGEAHV